MWLNLKCDEYLSVIRMIIVGRGRENGEKIYIEIEKGFLLVYSRRIMRNLFLLHLSP